MSELVQIITAFIGSLGFGLLFNIREKRLLFAALGGMAAWTLFLLLGLAIDDEVVRYFIVSVVMSCYCEIMARVLKTPTTTFLMTVLIPLVPGGGLYYTLENAFSGNYIESLEKGFYTLYLAVALALGVIVSTVIFRIISKSKAK